MPSLVGVKLKRKQSDDGSCSSFRAGRSAL